MAQRITTGIDIGTHHTKVVIAEAVRGKDRGLPRIVGTGIAESRGLRQGYIVNTADAIKSITRAVRQAEEQAGTRVKRAFLSIGGVGLAEIRGEAEVVVSKGDLEVTDLDIERAITKSQEQITDRLLNRHILHTIPQRYLIDDAAVLGRPQGMRGKKIAVETLFVTALEQHVQDIVQAVEESGIIVEDVMAAPIAASLVTLTKPQKMAGCVLANIGSETVSLTVFEHGIPVSVAVLPIGARDVTNDIALGLQVSLDDAERVKLGAIINADVSQRQLDRIISARLSDIFDLIRAHLKEIGKDGLLPAGIVITGGGSGLTAIDTLAKSALRIPSKVTLPGFGKHPKVKDGTWAVAYGLVIWGLSAEEEPSVGVRLVSSTGQGLVGWLKKFLP